MFQILVQRTSLFKPSWMNQSKSINVVIEVYSGHRDHCRNTQDSMRMIFFCCKYLHVQYYITMLAYMNVFILLLEWTILELFSYFILQLKVQWQETWVERGVWQCILTIRLMRHPKDKDFLITHSSGSPQYLSSSTHAMHTHKHTIPLATWHTLLPTLLPGSC